MSNPFYKNQGPFTINEILKSIGLKDNNLIKDETVSDIKDLNSSNKDNITFFHSKKYKDIAKNTKASFCITNELLKNELPKKCVPIIVNNILLSVSKVTSKFYPDSINDHYDNTIVQISKTKFKDKVKCGENVLLGENVSIGDGCLIGHNTIIEKNVVIGKNCIIGSNVIIKNSIFGERVVIQDNCKIGQKGFGFIPVKDNNIKFPHIGRVLISDNVEIASGCTIDRGSVDDTTIGKNTYLDNQVHVAHNVKIGSNCMIAGQVGFAGSTKVGNNVSIGGQAGISGHLIIGNNVKIGGGSGVVKDIGDNQIVMGYPAVP